MDTTSFVFNSLISLVRVTFVAVRVVIVCLSPVVVLEMLYIPYSALCFFVFAIILRPWMHFM